MLCNAWSVKYKADTLWDVTWQGGFDLIHLRSGCNWWGGSCHPADPLPSLFGFHQSWPGRQWCEVAILNPDGFTLWKIPALEIPGVECVDLMWNAGEWLAISLVYHLPSSPADILRLAEQSLSVHWVLSIGGPGWFQSPCRHCCVSCHLKLCLSWQHWSFSGDSLKIVIWPLAMIYLWAFPI